MGISILPNRPGGFGGGGEGILGGFKMPDLTSVFGGGQTRGGETQGDANPLGGLLGGIGGGVMGGMGGLFGGISRTISDMLSGAAGGAGGGGAGWEQLVQGIPGNPDAIASDLSLKRDIAPIRGALDFIIHFKI